MEKRRRQRYRAGWAWSDKYVARGNCPIWQPWSPKAGFRFCTRKDEYEVARLYTHPRFRQSLAREFTGDFSLKVHLAPPILSRIDSATGRPVKRAFGSWIFIVFRDFEPSEMDLAITWLDPFRYTQERQLAREIRKEYEKTLERLCAGFDKGSPQIAEHIAQWPMQVRGFGPGSPRGL